MKYEYHKFSSVKPNYSALLLDESGLKTHREIFFSFFSREHLMKILKD